MEIGHNRKRPISLPISPSLLLSAGKKINDPLARALFFFLYLTGARISEATEFSMAKLTMTRDLYIIRLPVLKRRSEFWRNIGREIIIPRGKFAKCHEEQMISYVINYAEKFKTKPTEKMFAKWIYHRKGKAYSNMSVYLRRLIKLNIEQYTPKFDGQWIQTTKEIELSPHYLRHCRATHLVTYYNLNELHLQKFFEWASSRMAQRYVKIRDLKDIMCRDR